MTGNASTAVRARRVAAPESEDPLRKRWRELDWFATPPWATRAGAMLVKQLDPHASKVWEPACGDGIMADVLREFFVDVGASDLEPQGDYGEKLDFLREDFSAARPHWIITNPPFNVAQPFIEKSLTIATRGVAMLLRLSFLEGVERYDLHFSGSNRLAYVAPFSERVPMQLGPWNPRCSSATAYAWFVYRRDELGPAIVRPIPPGTRQRLFRENDIKKFVRAGDVPLLARA